MKGVTNRRSTRQDSHDDDDVRSNNVQFLAFGG